MLMDYILNPVICVIWCSQAARNIVPGVPYAFWVLASAAASTFLNTRAIQTSGRLSAILSVAMGLVAILFLGEGVRYIIAVLHPCAADPTPPFYDPATFSGSAVLRGTSVAVLTDIGFDGISTMAEEVENPRPPASQQFHRGHHPASARGRAPHPYLASQPGREEACVEAGGTEAFRDPNLLRTSLTEHNFFDPVA